MLDERQKQVCELLAKGTIITDVAKIVKVSRQTIYDWKKLEEIKAMVDALGQEYLSATIATMHAEGPKSMLALIKLRDTASSEKVRLEAAAKILDKLVSNATKISIDDTREDSTVDKDILDGVMDEADVTE